MRFAVLLLAAMAALGRTRAANQRTEPTHAPVVIPLDMQLAYYKAHAATTDAQRAAEQTPQARDAVQKAVAEGSIVRKLFALCGEGYAPREDIDDTGSDRGLVCVATKDSEKPK